MSVYDQGNREVEIEYGVAFEIGGATTITVAGTKLDQAHRKLAGLITQHVRRGVQASDYRVVSRTRQVSPWTNPPAPPLGSYGATGP